MSRLVLAAGLVLLLVAPAWAVTENISWTNPNDPSVTGINVQTAATPAGPFVNANASPLAPSATSFSRTIPINAQDCVQVIWVNSLGASAPLGPSCGTPNAAQKGSGLTIIFQP